MMNYDCKIKNRYTLKESIMRPGKMPYHDNKEVSGFVTETAKPKKTYSQQFK